jgi:hypothetical protein
MDKDTLFITTTPEFNPDEHDAVRDLLRKLAGQLSVEERAHLDWERESMDVCLDSRKHGVHGVANDLWECYYYDSLTKLSCVHRTLDDAVRNYGAGAAPVTVVTREMLQKALTLALLPDEVYVSASAGMTPVEYVTIGFRYVETYIDLDKPPSDSEIANVAHLMWRHFVGSTEHSEDFSRKRAATILWRCGKDFDWSSHRLLTITREHMRTALLARLPAPDAHVLVYPNEPAGDAVEHVLHTLRNIDTALLRAEIAAEGLGATVACLWDYWRRITVVAYETPEDAHQHQRFDFDDRDPALRTTILLVTRDHMRAAIEQLSAAPAIGEPPPLEPVRPRQESSRA